MSVGQTPISIFAILQREGCFELKFWQFCKFVHTLFLIFFFFQILSSFVSAWNRYDRSMNSSDTQRLHFTTSFYKILLSNNRSVTFFRRFPFNQDEYSFTGSLFRSATFTFFHISHSYGSTTVFPTHSIQDATSITSTPTSFPSYLNIDGTLEISILRNLEPQLWWLIDSSCATVQVVEWKIYFLFYNLIFISRSISTPLPHMVSHFRSWKWMSHPMWVVALRETETK